MRSSNMGYPPKDGSVPKNADLNCDTAPKSGSRKQGRRPLGACEKPESKESLRRLASNTPKA